MLACIEVSTSLIATGQSEGHESLKQRENDKQSEIKWRKYRDHRFCDVISTCVYSEQFARRVKTVWNQSATAHKKAMNSTETLERVAWPEGGVWFHKEG